MESAQILASIFGLLFSMVLIGISAGVTVHVDHQDQDVSSESLPDELNATIVNESGTATFLQLQRAKHIVPNVPVYTLNVDNEGKYVTRREILQKTQNVGYYQDVSAGAALQVKRMEASEDKSYHFILKGELIIAGQSYKLDHGPSPGKREAGAAPSSEYSLEPIKAISASQIGFIDPQIPKHPEQDVLFQPMASGHTPSATSRIKRQTSGPTNIYIDVVIVADYGLYKLYRSESRPKDKDLNSLREYVSFVANGMDVRYRNIKSSKFAYQVSLARLIIAETAAASDFTENENLKRIIDGEEYVLAGPALSAFADFTEGAGKDVIDPRDHAMLISGYELGSLQDNGEIYAAVGGMAYMSTACKPSRSASSVVEYWRDYSSAGIAAHELAHGLGSGHDGNTDNCQNSTGYVMGSFRLSPDGYYFSDCSVSDFEEYISDQLNNEIGQKCFLEQLPVSPDIPDVSNRLPGQEYPVNEQCRMFKGEGSTVCWYHTNQSDFCLGLYCWLPSGKFCVGYPALEGTTCGNGKMCLNGLCVSDPRAPAVDEDCILGDYVGVAYDNQTCEEYINSFTGNCYDSDVKHYCCVSCKKASRKLSGCEYGDTVKSCDPSLCINATPEYLGECCGTCNYGTPLPESVNTQAAAFVTESQQAETSDSTSPVAKGAGFF